MKSRHLLVMAASFLVFGGFGMPGVAHAATEPNDLAVGFKTLPMFEGGLPNDLGVAVVYLSGKADSKADAENIKQVIDGGGVKAPDGATLTVHMVPMTELAKLSAAKIVLLSAGLGAPDFAAVSAAIAGKGVLTMSADLNCVRANQCVLGLVSKPTVEIYYSRAAAAAAGVSFMGVFTMLVKLI